MHWLILTNILSHAFSISKELEPFLFTISYQLCISTFWKFIDYDLCFSYFFSPVFFHRQKKEYMCHVTYILHSLHFKAFTVIYVLQFISVTFDRCILCVINLFIYTYWKVNQNQVHTCNIKSVICAYLKLFSTKKIWFPLRVRNELWVTI